MNPTIDNCDISSSEEDTFDRSHVTFFGHTSLSTLEAAKKAFGNQQQTSLSQPNSPSTKRMVKHNSAPYGASSFFTTILPKKSRSEHNSCGFTQTPTIFDCINKGLITQAEQMIGQNPTLLNASDKSGNTPLHLAVQKGLGPLVGKLLFMKANLQIMNNECQSPLHLAGEDTFIIHEYVKHLILQNINWKNMLEDICKDEILAARIAPKVVAVLLTYPFIGDAEVSCMMLDTALKYCSPNEEFATLLEKDTNSESQQRKIEVFCRHSNHLEAISEDKIQASSSSSGRLSRRSSTQSYSNRSPQHRSPLTTPVDSRSPISGSPIDSPLGSPRFGTPISGSPPSVSPLRDDTPTTSPRHSRHRLSRHESGDGMRTKKKDSHGQSRSGRQHLRRRRSSASKISSQAVELFWTSIVEGKKDIVDGMIAANPNLLKLKRDGASPMHEVSKRMNAEMIIYLAEKGVDCNTPDASGRLPLHLLLCKPDLRDHASNVVASVRALLTAQADPFLATERMQSPISYVIPSGLNDLAYQFTLNNVHWIKIIEMHINAGQFLTDRYLSVVRYLVEMEEIDPLQLVLMLMQKPYSRTQSTNPCGAELVHMLIMPFIDGHMPGVLELLAKDPNSTSFNNKLQTWARSPDHYKILMEEMLQTEGNLEKPEYIELFGRLLALLPANIEPDISLIEQDSSRESYRKKRALLVGRGVIGEASTLKKEKGKTRYHLALRRTQAYDLTMLMDDQVNWLEVVVDLVAENNFPETEEQLRLLGMLADKDKIKMKDLLQQIILLPFVRMHPKHLSPLETLVYFCLEKQEDVTGIIERIVLDKNVDSLVLKIKVLSQHSKLYPFFLKNLLLKSRPFIDWESKEGYPRLLDLMLCHRPKKLSFDFNCLGGDGDPQSREIKRKLLVKHRMVSSSWQPSMNR